MYYPTLKEFLKLSVRYNVIPVYKEINADLDTPVSAFLKIKRGGYAFLLESVEGQEKIARYSFLGANPSLVFKSKGKLVEIYYPKQKRTRRFITKTTPLDEIKSIMQGVDAAQVKGLPRFFGGLVGYIGYDFVRFFEEIPAKNPDDLKLFDAVFMLTDTLLVFDHVNHTIKIVNNVVLPKNKSTIKTLKSKKAYYSALEKIEGVQRDLSRALQQENNKHQNLSPVRIKSNLTKRQFCAIVQQAKNYIKRGDVIQVVLSQRFKSAIRNEPFDIYRKLRSLNPSPYMFFLDFKDVVLAGSSPEMLVRCENGTIETRPIAGTRPRGKDEEQDLALEKELKASEKEKAEHIMLVDLGRNDIGRVCKWGRVMVEEFMQVERYSHVMHLVSSVRGVLENKYDCFSALKSCFPAGTVTGSPKIRAMEIIDELENMRRGPYAGCVGYFSFSHNMDTCITIRTIVIKGDTAYIQAGAGIVADSVPHREYTETVNKAKALFEAIS